MSARNQKRVMKMGFDKWDPFAEPKDPIEIRRDPTHRTAHQLVVEFMQSSHHKTPSDAYRRGVLEAALGIINQEDRIIGMVEFIRWYQQLLNQEKNPPE